MATPLTDSTPGTRTWTADFTGPALVLLYGAGGGGAAGQPLQHGGAGGGGGLLSVSRINVVSGGVYPYTIGAGGVGGTYAGGAGGDGGDTYWGDGLLYRANGGKGGTFATPGAAGTVDASVGDSRVPGQPGKQPATGNTFAGGNGGRAGGDGGGAGATGAQSAGTAGSTPGGAGSGGGQASGGRGGAGAPGQIYIDTAPAIRPGYYSEGVSFAADGTPTYGLDGTFTWLCPADGDAIFEAWGAGGGARGGNAFSLQGAAGGGGGAYSSAIWTTYRNVNYQRVVGTGGAGTDVNGAAGSAGGDTSITLAPVSVSNKQIVSNVATLTVAKHGFEVGQSIVVSGVDATFNGTFTITAINAARTTLSYAKTAASTSGSASGSVAANFNIVLAKGGSGGTGYRTGPGAGGLASGGVGTIKINGGKGVVSYDGNQNGNSGGSGALPGDGLGGWGGGDERSTSSPTNRGNVGRVPGGGGGGGAAKSNGTGGAGAIGAATIRYFLSYGYAFVNGEARPITKIRYKDNSGSVKTVNEPFIARSNVWVPSSRVRRDEKAGIRRAPTYTPPGSENLFDPSVGTFNWKVGAAHVKPAILAKNFQWVHVGDSYSDGSTHLNPVNAFDYDVDPANAFPRKARDFIATAAGTIAGGTGLVRPDAPVTPDPQWNRGSWTRKTSYLQSNNTSHVATFTPVVQGTSIAVVTVGAGVVSIKIDGVSVGNSVAAPAGVVTRTVFNGLTLGNHVVSVSPASGTCFLMGVDVYRPGTGIRVHNVSQGGAGAAFDPGDSSPQQNVWSDTQAAPGGMLSTYSQQLCYDSRPNAVVIMLGANDFDAAIPDVVSAFGVIGDAFDHPDTDIILVPDVAKTERMVGLMELCLTKGWALIDYFWLNRELQTLFSDGYSDDPFGHLNVTRSDGGVPGVQYVGNLYKQAFMS